MVDDTESGDRLRANRALDAVDFFLADVRGGLATYLAIYLLTERKPNEADIGLVMAIATVAGIRAQTPAGVVVDATRAKRAVMVAFRLLAATSVASLISVAAIPARASDQDPARGLRDAAPE